MLLWLLYFFINTTPLMKRRMLIKGDMFAKANYWETKKKFHNLCIWYVVFLCVFVVCLISLVNKEFLSQILSRVLLFTKASQDTLRLLLTSQDMKTCSDNDITLTAVNNCRNPPRNGASESFYGFFQECLTWWELKMKNQKLNSRCESVVEQIILWGERVDNSIIRFLGFSVIQLMLNVM